jgi:hypothetical protein
MTNPGIAGRLTEEPDGALLWRSPEGDYLSIRVEGNRLAFVVNGEEVTVLPMAAQHIAKAITDRSNEILGGYGIRP